MRVKQILLEALSRANHINDGSPADSRELTKARKHFASALTAYSDSNLITAFQRVVTVTGKEEMVLGKYNMKKGKVMHFAGSFENLPDASRLTIGKDYGEYVTDSGDTNFAGIGIVGGVQTWFPSTGNRTLEQKLVDLDCCDFVPDKIVFNMERVVAAMQRRPEERDLPYTQLQFVPLTSFYTNDAWDTYCAVPAGDNKVRVYLPKALVGREVKLVYNTRMMFKDDDYLELPSVYQELLTLATTVGLLSEDADSDPTQLNNYSTMLTKLENQVAANNVNTRRIVRRDEKHLRPLYTGQFIYGRFVP